VQGTDYAVSLAWTHTLPPWAFFTLPARAWELAAGGLVALSAHRWSRLPVPAATVVGSVGLALVVVACARLGGTTPYPGTAALLPVLGTALAVGAGCAAPSRGIGRGLSLPPMRALGRLSYSWYLWHWPVLPAPPLLGPRACRVTRPRGRRWRWRVTRTRRCGVPRSDRSPSSGTGGWRR
jgi:peptidoglycan/LPS O-acetylase OafA/YrhL